ncbi:MAG: diguanylate cyclase, partial [Sulfitobacter sp.]|nr:diguanylate cyclase [Sulfitobacter sp.]
QPRDSVALAAWFAASFGAPELLVVGADLPAEAAVPLRARPVSEPHL